MFPNERRRKKIIKAQMLLRTEELCSASGPLFRLLFNSLLYVSMHEWKEGRRRNRDGLVHFSWIWDNEDRERKIRDDKGEMTNSREDSAVILLQWNFLLNKERKQDLVRKPWHCTVDTTIKYSTNFCHLLLYCCHSCHAVTEEAWTHVWRRIQIGLLIN